MNGNGLTSQHIMNYATVKKNLAMFSIAIFRPDEVLSVEKKNGKSARISWIMPNDLDRWKPLIYIIQQKSHIGMVN